MNTEHLFHTHISLSYSHKWNLHVNGIYPYLRSTHECFLLALYYVVCVLLAFVMRRQQCVASVSCHVCDMTHSSPLKQSPTNKWGSFGTRALQHSSTKCNVNQQNATFINKRNCLAKNSKHVGSILAVNTNDFASLAMNVFYCL